MQKLLDGFEDIGKTKSIWTKLINISLFHLNCFINPNLKEYEWMPIHSSHVCSTLSIISTGWCHIVQTKEWWTILISPEGSFLPVRHNYGRKKESKDRLSMHCRMAVSWKYTSLNILMKIWDGRFGHIGTQQASSWCLRDYESFSHSVYSRKYC